MRGMIAAARRRVAGVLTPPTTALVGTYNAGLTAATTYTIPAGYAIDDVMVLVVESGATTGVVTPPTGWTHITGSPRAQGSNVVSISVMWKRVTSLSETNPSVAGQANHQLGNITVFRGCITTGTPFELPVGSGSATVGVSHAVGTTTGAQELVALWCASSVDATTDQFGAFTNGSLSSVTKVGQGGTLNGNGGSITFVTGVRAVAGNAGTFTATHAAGVGHSDMSIVLIPAPV